MTKLEFTCSDEKSVFLLKAARLYDEGVKLEPVRHGEWKKASGCRTICNNCGHYPLYDYFGRLKLSPYCWFCGVKMGGDKVGEGN